MSFRTLLAAILLTVACGGSSEFANPFAERVWDSAYVLYRTDTDRQVCGTFPVEQRPEGAYFVTATHCQHNDLTYEIGKGNGTPTHSARMVAKTEGYFGIAVFLAKGMRVKPVSIGSDPAIGNSIYLAGRPHAQYPLLVSGIVSGPLQKAGFFPTTAASGSGMSGSAIWCVAAQAVCGVQIAHYSQQPLLSLMAPLASQLAQLKWRVG